MKINEVIFRFCYQYFCFGKKSLSEAKHRYLIRVREYFPISLKIYERNLLIDHIPNKNLTSIRGFELEMTIWTDILDTHPKPLLKNIWYPPDTKYIGYGTSIENFEIMRY